MELSKDEIRKAIKDLRFQMDESVIKSFGSLAANHFLKSEIYEKAKEIMIYMPLAKEADTTKIISKAISDGKRLAFPVTDIFTNEIVPFYAAENTSFQKGAFSVMEPQNSIQADLSEIDVVIVPGIAFDKNGARVGFGKGCYDRFLKKITATRVGFCYDFQILEKLETEEHDIKMDFLVTESGFFDCKI